MQQRHKKAAAGLNEKPFTQNFYTFPPPATQIYLSERGNGPDCKLVKYRVA